MPGNDRQRRFLEAEQKVAAQSAGLKKELRLGDLVLSQLLYISGLQWVGTAAKMGSEHVMYWIAAVLLFYIPSGLVVVHLNQEMPVEGGLYQWAKLRFGGLVGFLVAWNLWATLVLILASSFSQIADSLAYLAGPSGRWIVEEKSVTVAVAMLLMGGLMAFARRGLALAKWLHNSGGTILVLVLAGMLGFAIPRWWHGTAAVAPVTFIPSAVSLLNLNLLGKMGFAAFAGFDGCAIFAGEIRDPDVARTIRRSVWYSAPVIALFYILGTACVLAFTQPGQLDLITPTTQMLTRGAQAVSISALVAPLASILMICYLIGSESLYFNALIRLPMVAGWDHLLPAWLSRLHPRYKTPVGSILCIGVATVVLTILGNLGVGAQESFQMLNNAGLICWALTYLVMFAIPLVARGERPPLGIRIAAASGFFMSLLYVVLSIFPIIDVKDVAAFTVKMSGTIVGINAAGAVYYWLANKRRRVLFVRAE